LPIVDYVLRFIDGHFGYADTISAKDTSIKSINIFFNGLLCTFCVDRFLGDYFLGNLAVVVSIGKTAE
jgi:hypothetical protein